MHMTDLERTRRVVAAAYADRNASELTFEHLDSLERENDELCELIEEKRQVRRDGRYVSGRTIATSVLSIALAVGFYWYNFTLEGSCFREGMQEGSGGAPSTAAAACSSHDNDSILSGRSAIASTDHAGERR